MQIRNPRPKRKWIDPTDKSVAAHCDQYGARGFRCPVCRADVRAALRRGGT